MNAGSLNFALFHIKEGVSDWKYDWELPYLEGTEDFIFPNTFKTMRQYLEIIYSNAAKPEFEIYDVGMINNLAFLLEKGIARRPGYLQFVMGILGGIPATLENLVFLLETARKQIGEFEFSVCAAGRHQIPLCTGSLLLGGHARVGLEDSLYLSKGVLAKSSAEQVTKMVTIARELGIEPATPDEARQQQNQFLELPWFLHRGDLSRSENLPEPRRARNTEPRPHPIRRDPSVAVRSSQANMSLNIRFGIFEDFDARFFDKEERSLNPARRLQKHRPPLGFFSNGLK